MKDLIRLYMQQTGGSTEDAARWAEQVLQEDEEALANFAEQFKLGGEFVLIQDYIQELERRAE